MIRVGRVTSADPVTILPLVPPHQVILGFGGVAYEQEEDEEVEVAEIIVQRGDLRDWKLYHS